MKNSYLNVAHGHIYLHFCQYLPLQLFDIFDIWTIFPKN